MLLTVDVGAANRHESLMLALRLDAMPAVCGRAGRPRRRPRKLHADKAYDHRRCREAGRLRGITPRIARRGIEANERLGRDRWVVERTLGWLTSFRKLTIRYARRAEIHLAFLILGCAPICFNRLHHEF